MIVSRIQLYCDDPGCSSSPLRQRRFWPEEGPVDGALFTYGELRKSARDTAGWVRFREEGPFGQVVIDLCPNCASARKRKAAAPEEDHTR